MSLSRAKVRQACSQPPSKMGSFPTSGFLSSDTVPPWAQHPPGNASQLACETRGQGRQLEHGAHVACFAWSSKSFVFAPEVSCLLPALMGLRAGCQLPGGVEAQTAPPHPPPPHGSNPPCCWEREMPGCAGPVGRVPKWWLEHFVISGGEAGYSQALGIPTQDTSSTACPWPWG